MAVTLESLELGTHEFAAARDAVQKSAYFNWLDAGCPTDRQEEFWLKAERDWISYFYVPQRTPKKSRSRTDQTENRGNDLPLPASKAPRRRAVASVG